jgi:hypothetical protein
LTDGLGYTERVSTADDERAERARARNHWVIRRTVLDDPGPSLLGVTTPAQRVAMMWPLAVEAYRVAGRPIPEFEWPQAPSRVIRPGDAESWQPDEFA